MKRTTKCVGLDVHQATTVIAVLDERGRVIARSVVETAAEALVDFCRGCEARSAWSSRKAPRPSGFMVCCVPSWRKSSSAIAAGTGSRGTKGITPTPSSSPIGCGGGPAVGLSRQSEPGDPARAGAHVSDGARRFHAHDAAAEGGVSRARNSNARAACVSSGGTCDVAGRAVPARRAAASRGALRRARDATAVAPHDPRRAPRGSETGSRVARAAHDSVSRADSGRAVTRDTADAVALSHQAPALGVCGLGGRHTCERRI